MKVNSKINHAKKKYKYFLSYCSTGLYNRLANCIIIIFGGALVMTISAMIMLTLRAALIDEPGKNDIEIDDDMSLLENASNDSW